MLVVAIMMMLDTMQSKLALQMLVFRPMKDAMGPAPDELMKAPSVIREEINCWRSVEMFHPLGSSGAS